MPPPLLLQQSTVSVFDPAQDASQVGYREISGDVPSTGDRVFLWCWASVFDEPIKANSRYRDLVDALGKVDGEGLATTTLPHYRADRFGNMSERTDSIGDFTTIWVTATSGAGEDRGAILAAVNDALLHLLALSPYDAQQNDRAVGSLERLASSMDARQSDLTLAPWADTMSRLPILQDLDGILENSRIEFNRYAVTA